MPFAPKIYELEKLRRRGHQPDAAKVADDWADITREVKALQAKLKDEKLPATASLTAGADAVTTLKQTIGSIS
jgi:hypothetical protein